MSKIFLVFPNSLFENNKYINDETKIYIIEHPTFFTHFKYHKLKLILHRASMKYYKSFLKKKFKSKVKYINFNQIIAKIFHKHKKITFFDPVDHMLMKNLKQLSKIHKVTLDIKETPLFLTKLKDLDKYSKNKKSFSHQHFYKWQRKKHNILMKKNNKPIGNKWSFDTQNRLPFPKNFKNNYKPKFVKNKYINEAIRYINKYFSKNPGETKFYLPIDHQGAKKHFRLFLKNRLKCFGPYQDAVNKNIPFGCHSILSPLINIGLITPLYIVKETEKYGLKKKIPLQSLEGFIRQIVGWRDVQRLVYMFKRKELEKSNYFNHKNRLNSKIWFKNSKKINIKLIDDMIEKTFKYAYLHHIERLMYIGNFMLITKTHPDEVFKWFMSLFIDAYQWVMYGNVYAMSQYSTGRLLMNRPYFSSSNYINKMSNYKKHKDKNSKIIIKKKKYEWFQIWDALFYNFLSDNEKIFKKNYAHAALIKHWKNKSSNEKREIKYIAQEFMKKY